MGHCPLAEGVREGLQEKVGWGKGEGTGETGAYRQGRGLWARWQMALCARLRGLNLFPTGDGEPYRALLIMMAMLLILQCLLHGRHYSKK